MKKSVVIAIILMSCLLIGCILLNNKKAEEIKKPKVTTPSGPTKDYSKVQLDPSGIMAAYEEKKYYGKNNLVKHTVTIRNGYGDVKNIDLTDINFSINEDPSQYFQKCMRDESISIVKNIGKVPDEILDKIKRVTDIELDYEELPRDRVTNEIEDTNYYYYCASGNGSSNLKLIKSYSPVNNYSASSNNKDLKDIMKYFFGW